MKTFKRSRFRARSFIRCDVWFFEVTFSSQLPTPFKIPPRVFDAVALACWNLIFFLAGHSVSHSNICFQPVMPEKKPEKGIFESGKRRKLLGPGPAKFSGSGNDTFQLCRFSGGFRYFGKSSSLGKRRNIFPSSKRTFANPGLITHGVCF